MFTMSGQGPKQPDLTLKFVLPEQEVDLDLQRSPPS